MTNNRLDRSDLIILAAGAKHSEACDGGCSFVGRPAAEAAVDAILSALKPTSVHEAASMLPSCVSCGRIVDPREVCEGGDEHGAMIDEEEEEWVCSRECEELTERNDKWTDRKQALINLRNKVKAGALSSHATDLLLTRSALGDEWYSFGRAYDGSLGAAKALHEAVLPDQSIRIERRVGGWVVWLDNPFQGISDYPARAWLLAILEALIAQEG